MVNVRDLNFLQVQHSKVLLISATAFQKCLCFKFSRNNRKCVFMACTRVLCIDITLRAMLNETKESIS